MKEHHIFGIRIDERKSTKAKICGKDKWLYPDVVGVKNLARDWPLELVEAVDIFTGNKHQLWSFEVKDKITIGSVREDYFQALSNSSWPNAGYLVTDDKLTDDDIKEELRILSGRHGIGVIILNKENPAQSQILIPAKIHDSIDWDTVKRIYDRSHDFKDFIEIIKHKDIGNTIKLFKHLNSEPPSMN